jgi:nucleoid-associated protein YgaU
MDDEKMKRSESKPAVDASSFAGDKIKAEHVVKEGDTLSGIALKYYGSAAKDMWMKIFEKNKSVIGDDPNMIEPGQRLRIPDID